MVESSPIVPYNDCLEQLAVVEDNMLLRRNQALEILNIHKNIITMSHFPMIGCKNFTEPTFDMGIENINPITKSIFFPAQAISKHPRYKACAESMYKRKLKKLTANIPIFVDAKTSSPFKELFTAEEDSCLNLENHIYMDTTSLGFASCSLQVTVQAANLKQATHLYDQLTVVSPIMLALSASSPFYRGYISDVDTRWKLLTQLCDDRNETELSTIKSSRFSSVQMYISQDHSQLNDVPVSINNEAYDFLVSQKVDSELSKHIAHLWTRDPLVLFPDEVKPESENTYCHFENIQSTVWQDLRFKPPPHPSSDIGWRVEFRPLEVQPSEFENSAFAVYMVLLVRAMIYYEVDLTIPMSLVHSNMEKAQANDACRKNLYNFPNSFNSCKLFSGAETEKSQVDLMSIDTIINGNSTGFVGLSCLVNEFVKTQNISHKTSKKIQSYIDHIGNISSGKTPTIAQKMRVFVKNHKDYKQDSKLNDKINFDMMKSLWKL